MEWERVDSLASKKDSRKVVEFRFLGQYDHVGDSIRATEHQALEVAHSRVAGGPLFLRAIHFARARLPHRLDGIDGDKK